MKAKHFKKLRQECRYYDVDESTMLFGRFNWDWKGSVRVFARSHFDAIRRARYKGYAKRKSQPRSTIYDSEEWATFRVKESDAPDKHKYVFYFQ
ncbi:hypothetical protein [Chryseobacterium indologenes]|uniref:hypothetical protein n=1 Tax=Chryseobacterium indologenes TaxID=253 RepID=UPI0009A1B9E1|nr:hypothetical protein [Chryseobacterium indologenes]